MSIGRMRVVGRPPLHHAPLPRLLLLLLLGAGVGLALPPFEIRSAPLGEWGRGETEAAQEWIEHLRRMAGQCGRLGG